MILLLVIVLTFSCRYDLWPNRPREVKSIDIIPIFSIIITYLCYSILVLVPCAMYLKYYEKCKYVMLRTWIHMHVHTQWSLSFYLSFYFSCKCKDGRPLSSRDRQNLQELEGKLQVLQRRGRHLEIAERNCCTRVGSALRPLKVSLHYGGN